MFSALKNSDIKNRLTGTLQIAAVIGIVLMAVIYSREPTAEAIPKPAAATRVAPVQLVSVIRPLPSPQQITIRTTGSVGVRNYVALTPQVTGKVVGMSPALRVGGTFKAGETLLSIETTDFELAIAQAQADVDSARANLMLQEAESQAAISNYRLLNATAKVPPLVAKTPQIERAKAQLSAAEARFNITRADLSRTTFSLPFSGRITESSAEVGQMLNRGQSFGRAFALDAVEATVPVTVEDIQSLTPVIGRQVEMNIDGVKHTGQVERIAAELDSRTRFSKLFISLDDQHNVIPGTFVTATIKGPDLNNTLTLPTAAEQGDGLLWIVEKGTLRQHSPVIRGFTDNGFIVDAFEFGEGIVTGSVPGGSEGQQVQSSDATL